MITKIVPVMLVGMAAVVVVTGCGGADDDPAAPPVRLGVEGGTSIAAEQGNGACAPGARSLTGKSAAGRSCLNATDCAPVCCPCASGAKGWSAAACTDGLCGDAKTACAASADDARYCQ